MLVQKCQREQKVTVQLYQKLVRVEPLVLELVRVEPLVLELVVVELVELDWDFQCQVQ